MMEIVLAVLSTFVFLVLKLCNVIVWDWIWVLSPIWILILLLILYIGLTTIAYFIYHIKSNNHYSKSKKVKW